MRVRKVLRESLSHAQIVRFTIPHDSFAVRGASDVDALAEEESLRWRRAQCGAAHVQREHAVAERCERAGVRVQRQYTIRGNVYAEGAAHPRQQRALGRDLHVRMQTLQHLTRFEAFFSEDSAQVGVTRDIASRLKLFLVDVRPHLAQCLLRSFRLNIS